MTKLHLCYNKCMSLGYSKIHKGYKCYDLFYGKLYISHYMLYRNKWCFQSGFYCSSSSEHTTYFWPPSNLMYISNHNKYTSNPYTYRPMLSITNSIYTSSHNTYTLSPNTYTPTLPTTETLTLIIPPLPQIVPNNPNTTTYLLPPILELLPITDSSSHQI